MVRRGAATILRRGRDPVAAPLGILPGVPIRLLGHLHGDHSHGLPFCPGLDHPDALIDVPLRVTATSPGQAGRR